MKPGQQTVGHPVIVASGTVYLTSKDVSIHGKIELVWERRYSTSLLDLPPGPLGPGWTTRYFCSLRRENDGYRFLTPEGDHEVFPDPDGAVERGGVVRLLGSFEELTKAGNRYIVTRWKVDSYGVEHYIFNADAGKSDWPLAAIENEEEHGLDLLRDETGRLVGIRQRLEKRTLVLEYTTGSRISSVSLLLEGNRRQLIASYHYDDSGSLSASTNALGNSDCYEYDALSHLTREVLKDGGTFVFRYGDKGRCVYTSGRDRYDEKRIAYKEHIGWSEVTDSMGAITRYQWLPSGQVAVEINPLGAVKRTEYDEHGRIVAKVNAVGQKTTFGYDELGNRCAIIEPGGKTCCIKFDARHQPVAVIDAAGNLWQREYDGHGRRVACVDPLGRKWTYAYNEQGNLLRIVDPAGATRRLGYTENGVLVEVTDWSGNPIRFEVDHMGRTTRRTDALGHQHRFEYDALGHCTAIQFPDGSRLVCEYDAGGNLTKMWDANGRLTTWRYGSCGRVVKRTDALGQSRRYFWGTEPKRLDRVVNEKGETHRFVYNADGQMIEEFTFDGRHLLYEYNLHGQNIAAINGLGERISYAYNDAGRVVEKTFPDGSTATFEYDLHGNVVAGSKGSSQVLLERDQLGRLVKEVQDRCTLEYEYDVIGNISKVKTSLGHQVTFDYDPRGFPTSFATADGHKMRFTHDLVGNETSRLLPGGLRLQQEFNAAGQVLEQTLISARHNIQGEVIIRRRYEYDRAGNLVVQDDNLWGPTRYLYDPIERLLQVAGRNGIEEFDYDPTGDITHIRSTTQGVETAEELAYLPGSRVVERGNTTYDYDANGRLISKHETIGSSSREWSYEWNADDELVRLHCPDGTVWSYEYDAFGRRISKQGPENVTYFVWDRDVIIHELGIERVLATWVFSPRGFTPLAKIEGRQIYGIITDHLGTPRELVSHTGEVVWAGSYKAWGEVSRLAANQVDCPIRFAGQWFDGESGLHYSWFRYYDPAHGHFISPDQIGLNGGLNERLYVPNPINWFDPWGLDPCADREKDEEGRVVIVIDKEKYPEAAQHIADNDPVVGLIDRPGAADRRAESLRGIPTFPGMDRDEVPPAVLSTGGSSASIRPIPPSDNRGAGASMGAQMRDLPNGTPVTIVSR